MPPKKKAATPLWEWQDDEDEWQAYQEADQDLLEENYSNDQLTFTTKFSFSKDSYKMDLKKLTQTNVKSKVVRNLRRNERDTKAKKARKKSDDEQQWFFKNDDGKWQAFAKEDAKMMEGEYQSRGESAKFTTTEFSFNTKHQTPYVVDFGTMTQLNKKSKVSRALKRGDESDATETSGQGESSSSEPPPGRAHLGEKVRAQAGGRVHFSGGLMYQTHIPGTCTKPYSEDEMSEYVGIGRYPENMKAFPKAIMASFDSVAVDAGTRCVIYSEPNFKGKVLWDKVGPALIANCIWNKLSVDGKEYEKSFSCKWAQPLHSIFPPSVRELSKSDMHAWNTGSLVIEGGHPIPKILKDKNPEYADLVNPTY